MKQDEIARLEALLDGPLAAMAYPLLAEAHRRAGRPGEAERVAREGLRGAAPATSGHIALALALLDQKRGDEARAELESLLGAGTEHAIAGDAVERSEPEASGIALERSQPEAAEPASAWSSSAAAALPEVEPATPMEPPLAGPFGPPPPPAPAEALVFGGDVDDDELDDAFDEAESDREQMIGADDVARAALSSVLDEEDDLEEEPEGDGLALADPTSPFATETVADLLTQQGHTEQAEEVRARLAGAPIELAAPRPTAAPSVRLEPLTPADVPDPEPLEPPVGHDAADSPVAPFDVSAPTTPNAEPGPAAAPEPLAEPEPFAEPEPLAGPEPTAAPEPPPESLDGPTRPERPRQPRTQATLERWLDNLRRDRP